MFDFSEPADDIFHVQQPFLAVLISLLRESDRESVAIPVAATTAHSQLKSKNAGR